MAAEPIDIELRDKIASSITSKLLAIADASLKAYGAVGQLTEALSQSSSTQLGDAAAKVADNQDKVAAAVKRTGAVARKAASDVNAFGETEADVTKRLQGVAQAAITASQNQIALANTAAAAANQQSILAKQTNASATASQTAAKAYTAQMQALLATGRAGGAGGAAAAGAVPTVPAGAAANTNAAAAAMKGLGGATVGTRRELLVLVHEFVSGNFNRIPGSILVLAERMGGLGAVVGALTGLLNPLNLAFAALVAVVAGYEIALASAEAAQRAFNNTLKVTQNAAGLTYDTYNELAKSIASANDVTISSSKEIVSALAASGRFQKDEIAEITDATIKLSKSTGQSTDDIVKDFIRAADGPAKYAEELQKKLAFVSPAVLNHIKELDGAGEHAEGMRVFSKGLFDYLSTHPPEVLTGLSKFFHDFKLSIDGATESLKANALALSQGNSPAQAITDLNKQLKEAKEGFYSVTEGIETFVPPNEALVKSLESQLAAITAQKSATEAAAKAQSDRTQQIKASGDALERLDSKFESNRGNAYKLEQELRNLKNTITEAEKDPTGSFKTDPRYLYAIANRAKIEADLKRKYRPEEPKNTAEETRATFLQKVNSELIKQASYYDEISERREALRKADEVDIQLAAKKIHGRTPAPLSGDERQQIIDEEALVQTRKRLSAATDQLYSASDTVRLRNYNEQQQALSALQEKGYLSAAETADAQRKITYEYDQATDKLFGFNKAIADETKLLGYNSRERQVQAAVLAEQNRLLPQGKKLSDDQVKSIEDQTRALQHLQDVAAASDQLYQQTAGAQIKLQAELEATSKAYKDGSISADLYNQKLVEIQVSTANLNLANGVGSFEDAVTSSLGRIREGYTNVAKGLSDSFGEFFKSAADGFANTAAHAIIFGGSFKEALGDVARQALEGLLASLIKLGIQYGVNALLSNTAEVEKATTKTAVIAEETAAALAAIGTTTAASVVAAGLTAAAWAPAAAAVSLASYGANAIPASAGIAETYALTSLLSAIPGFSEGGFTGNIASNQIAGVVHGSEFVTNAAATARNRPLLEAMNSGATVGTGNGGVVVYNQGTPQNYQQDGYDSEGRMRLIARDEIAQRAPAAVANDLRNPNSTTSKSLRDTHKVERKR